MTLKIFRTVLAVLLVVGVSAAPALAESGDASGARAPQDGTVSWVPLTAVGAGLVCIGGGLGIGRLAASAMEGTARQPEAGGQIRTSMIIAAALIEGFTFFALIVCIMAQ